MPEAFERLIGIESEPPARDDELPSSETVYEVVESARKEGVPQLLQGLFTNRGLEKLAPQKLTAVLQLEPLPATAAVEKLLQQAVQKRAQRQSALGLAFIKALR